MRKRYSYVGPAEIRDATSSSPPGTSILTHANLRGWLTENADDAASDGSITATFVIDESGVLRLAPRRSEHVACASGGPVLSAGEIAFASDTDASETSNQSTGFCPEPESWPTVAAALDGIGVTHPGKFTTNVVFRLCPNCGERNIVKDQWFVCELCETNLPAAWNFPFSEPQEL